MKASNLAISALLLVTSAGVCVSQTINIPAFWDKHCHEFHSDAGTLLMHHDAERPQAMLLAQASPSPVFQQKCAGCHGPAADLVRQTIVVEKGAVLTKKKRQPLDAFLAGHGRLTAAEQQVVVDALQRIATEVRPN